MTRAAGEPRKGRARQAHPSGAARRSIGRRWLAACLLGGLLAGCGATPLTVRYEAERDLWRARKEERRLSLTPGTAGEALAPAVRAYEEILRKYAVATAGNDSASVRVVVRVRAAAAQSLARLHFRRGAQADAARVLWEERERVRSDLVASLGVYSDLIQILARGSSSDSLVALYREMMDALPPGTPDGQPVAAVLEAPSRLGEVLSAAGRPAEADGALNQALGWYDGIASRSPGTSLEVAAYVQKANVLARLQRPREADAVLTEARRLAAAGPVEAGIIFSQAVLREQILRDPLGAVPVYREIIARFPDSSPAAQARLRLGIAFATAGRPDSALAAFQEVETAHARQPAIAAQARWFGAKVLMESGRESEALRQLRALQGDFPRTEPALRAPLDIASHYEKAGDLRAEAATLEEADAQYERIIRELKDDPRQADVVAAAFDHLAEARARRSDWAGTVEALAQRADAFKTSDKSPMALLQAASIAATKLEGDPQAPELALRLLRTLVERYPRHPLAGAAREKIAELGGSGS